MLTKLIKAYATYLKNAETIKELSSMTDRELSDIGISRHQIKEIVYNG